MREAPSAPVPQLEYRPEYFEENKPLARRSAERIVPIVMDLLGPASVLDVGCGTGTWLAVFRDLGVDDVLGIDADWIARDALEVPANRFVVRDLEAPLDLGRTFDLVVSLEVGEHLSPEAADGYVDSLVRHASAVLFSAAIPFQGGSHHVNEQWPEYWERRFSSRGYRRLDCIRPRVWEIPEVAWWYAQNTFLYVREDRLRGSPELSKALAETASIPRDLVHPLKFVEAADLSRLRASQLFWICANWVKGHRRRR